MSSDQTQTAVPVGQAPVEFEPMDRSQFLLKGALAAGALYGAAAVGPVLSRAFAQGGGDASKGDIEILNFALTLELLEADFYEVALKDVKLSSDYKAFAEEVGANEQEHVDALIGTIEDLGGKPAKAPTFTFPLEDEASFIELAITFEDTGVSAYNGAGPALESKELLATAGSIVQVEARHAGAIRFMAGEDPVVDPFDPTLTVDEVLEAVDPFIKS